MWFEIVLIILLIFGAYGLVTACLKLYQQGYNRRRALDDFRENTYEREAMYARSGREADYIIREHVKTWQDKFWMRYENYVSSMADDLTLILGVVLFFWLLR